MVFATSWSRASSTRSATDVFAENGFDRAPVREITRRASVNQAAINYHFGGKEALYHEVLRLAVAALSDASLLDEKKNRSRAPRRGGASLYPAAGDATPQTQPDRPLSAHFRRETLAPTAVYRDFIASEKLPLLDQAGKIVRRFLPAEAARHLARSIRTPDPRTSRRLCDVSEPLSVDFMSMTAYGATQAREHARIPLIEALQTSYARREFFSP